MINDDTGRITDKDLLPVTRINFGAGSAPSSGSYTLAKLECYGRSSFEGIPKSCHDLRQAGHRSNGFYIVKASRQLEMIYCDMNHSFDGNTTYHPIILERPSQKIFEKKKKNSANFSIEYAKS